MSELAFSFYTINLPELDSDSLQNFIMAKVEGAEFYERKPIPGVVFGASDNWKMIGNIALIVALLSDLRDLVQKQDNAPQSTITQQIVVNAESEGGKAMVVVNNDGIVINNTIMQSDQQLIDSLKKELRDSKARIEAIRDSIKHPQPKKYVDMVDALRKAPGWKQIK